MTEQKARNIVYYERMEYFYGAEIIGKRDAAD